MRDTEDPWLATHSTRFKAALDALRSLARSASVPIVMVGESGSGKTRLARLIHQWSPRANQPFHFTVLSALDDALASSGLFGHTAGAFTGARYARAGAFATARGGTLFLDELGKCSTSIQQKLLHVIETGEFQPVGVDRTVRVAVRLICATNVDLEEAVLDGRFLPDLFARVEAYRVEIPPLRQRRADIPHLARAVVSARANDCGYDTPPQVADDLMTALQRAPWPFNLRQLDTTIHRIMLDAHGADTLTLAHCRLSFPRLANSGARRGPLSSARVHQAVARTGSIVDAARELGVDRTTVHRCLRRAKNQPAPDRPPTGVPT